MNFPDASYLTGTGEELLSLSENGKPPTCRLKDGKSAHGLYTKLREADRESAHNRKLVQAMYDGEPPYNQGHLKQLGQGHRFNLDFGEGAARKEAALAPYNDLADSVDTIIRVRMTNGDETERAEKQQIIAEEHCTMLRRWNQFDFNLQLLADQFISHGVGICYHTHDIDWRYQVSGFGDFQIPRGTRANEADIEVAFCTRKYQVHTLYRFVSNPELAEKAGWDREAVIDVILRSTYGDSFSTDRSAKWEEFQAEIKNNDLFVAQGKSQTATIAHGWVQEFDGTVSHVMFDETGRNEKFLFQAPSRFQNINQCFTVFTYGVGNGYYHGIRGQGYKILPQIQSSNRLRNAALDAAFLELSLLVQPEDADDLTTMSLISVGAITVLPPALKVGERQFANKSAAVLPLIQDLSIQIQNNTSGNAQTTVDASVQGRDRVTGQEIRQRAQAAGTLSTAAMNLFYLPWGRLHREVFRRIQNPHYQQHHPGGKEVFEFRKRCLRRGVTFDDIQSVTDVDVVRAVGAGSAQMRMISFDELMPYIETLDPIGRNNLLRDKFAQRVGQGQVDRYIPRLATVRPVMDDRLAELENTDFRLGQSVKVSSADEHGIHLDAHIAAMQETVNALQSEQLDPQTAFNHLRVAVPHTKEHLGAVEGDRTRATKIPQWKLAINVLENLGVQLSHNLQEQLAAQVKEQQDQQQLAAGGATMSPELTAKLQEHTLRMKMIQDEHLLKMQNKAAEAQQQLAIRDLQSAQKISAGL